MTVKLNELQPVGEVASNPVQSHATYTIVFEFVKQNIMIDGIKGLRKIKENANGMFIAIKSKIFSINSINQSTLLVHPIKMGFTHQLQ